MFKFRDYCLNPTKPYYEKVIGIIKINFEVISQSNQTAIHVFQVNSQLNLHISIYNSRFTKKICLYKWEDGHYDVLYEK